MNTLTIMVGLPGSGKDTLIKKLRQERHFTSNAVELSSDALRVELFGFEDQSRNQKLFQTLHSLVKERGQQGRDVIYNATNISRKKRIALCNEMKKYFTNISVICCICPIDELLKRNKTRQERHLPEEVLERMIKNIQLPTKAEWDYTDCLYVYTGKSDRDAYELEFNMFEALSFNQENKHHIETLGEHIMTVMKGCKNNCLAYEAARYHDNGKIFCKTIDERGCGHFYGHNYVSAYLYITETMCRHKKVYLGLGCTIEYLILLIEFHDTIFNYNLNVAEMRVAYNKKYRGLDNEFWEAFEILTSADRLRP